METKKVPHRTFKTVEGLQYFFMGGGVWFYCDSVLESLKAVQPGFFEYSTLWENEWSLAPSSCFYLIGEQTAVNAYTG